MKLIVYDSLLLPSDFSMKPVKISMLAWLFPRSLLSVDFHWILWDADFHLLTQCVCVCVSLSMLVCVIHIYIYMNVWMEIWITAYVSLHMHVCMIFVRIHVCLFPFLTYLDVSWCVLCFSSKKKNPTTLKGTAELWRERQNLHHLLPAVPRDEAGQAAVSRGRDSDAAVDLHQIFPSEGRTGHSIQECWVVFTHVMQMCWLSYVSLHRFIIQLQM